MHMCFMHVRLLIVLFFVFRSGFAASSEDEVRLLKKYSDSLRYSPQEAVRIAYNDSFRELLATVLDAENPFSVNLDSVKTTISVLDAEDGRMRIISWILVTDREEYINHCAVLHRKRKGANERVYWLKEQTQSMKDSLFEEFAEDEWPGALYYQVQHFRKKRKNYYCVLGLDGHNSFFNRKVIDVLWVDRKGELHIGAPVFYSSPNDFTPQYRVWFEYADEATMLLRFEKAEKLITFSNLVPSQPALKGKKQFYIPDGRIDYYRLHRKGKWIYHEGLNDFDLKGNL